MMMDVFRWIEQTPLSVFVREDFYAYFVLLIFHAWGMAFLVGGGMAISLRILGVGKAARLERFRVFFPIMWFGAIMAIISGVLLLSGYPAKALTNWVFALKFTCFILAVLTVRHAARHYFPRAARGEPLPAGAQWLALLGLLLWAGGVACGKFLPYTNHLLLVS